MVLEDEMFKRKSRNKRKTLDLESLLLEARRIKDPKVRKKILAEKLKELIGEGEIRIGRGASKLRRTRLKKLIK
jgi:hypothetical protein